MEDMSDKKTVDISAQGAVETPAATDIAKNIALLLADHNGGDVATLDLRELGSWTDFFVVATVTSRTHTEGLIKAVKDYCKENDIEMHRGRRRLAPGDEWALMDLGTVVVHLMTKAAREFYDLERLWSTPAGDL
jgi:ribosome-associated protein